MQSAEGKGPKQIKTSNFYPTGQFKTIYGNDGAPTGTPYITTPPYSNVVGTTNISGTQWNGGFVGSVVPGLNINVNGNGATDVGYVCSPSPSTSLQDMNAIYTLFSFNTTFTGTVYLQLQGSNDRNYSNTDYTSPSWITLLSGTFTNASGNQTFSLNNASGTFAIPRIAYRVTASGATASGIIDWNLPGFFVDYNAMGIGLEAADANGNIGQMSIQRPRNLTISGGRVISTSNGTPPYSPNKNNDSYIG